MINNLLVIKRFCRNYEGEPGNIVKCKVSIASSDGRSIDEPGVDVRYVARILTCVKTKRTPKDRWWNSRGYLIYESVTLDLDKGRFTKHNKRVRYLNEKLVIEKIRHLIGRAILGIG